MDKGDRHGQYITLDANGTFATIHRLISRTRDDARLVFVGQPLDRAQTLPRRREQSNFILPADYRSPGSNASLNCPPLFSSNIFETCELIFFQRVVEALLIPSEIVCTGADRESNPFLSEVSLIVEL